MNSMCASSLREDRATREPRPKRSRPSGRVSHCAEDSPEAMLQMAAMQKVMHEAVARPEWHLVCITRHGKVSMLRDLDLRTARETYRRLLPETRPKKYHDPECAKCQKRDHYGMQGCYMTSGSDSDYLEKVEVIGPKGRELDPWHGVEPRIINLYHCHCPPPPPPWDAKRTDFWNNPKLWEGLDPTRQLCWMPSR